MRPRRAESLFFRLMVSGTGDVVGGEWVKAIGFDRLLSDEVGDPVDGIRIHQGTETRDDRYVGIVRTWKPEQDPAGAGGGRRRPGRTARRRPRPRTPDSGSAPPRGSAMRSSRPHLPRAVAGRIECPTAAGDGFRWWSKNSNVSCKVRFRSSPPQPWPAPMSNSTRPGTPAAVCAAASLSSPGSAERVGPSSPGTSAPEDRCISRRRSAARPWRSCSGFSWAVPPR